MPTKSKSQERLMQAVAHNPAFAKKVGIKQSVGKEFVGKPAAKKRSFAAGGSIDGCAQRGKTRAKRS